MTSPMESLPLLILERVCEYLDDQSATRQSLRAFALTSRCLYAAAAAQRFSQLEIWVRDPDELESSLKRWKEVLTDGRHRHVRRLKISWGSTAEERARSPPRQHENLDMDGYPTNGWNVRPYFHMHNFCRPSEASMQGNGEYSLTDYPENWAALGLFVSQFPGLQDFIWAAGGQIPSPVLSAVSERKCRLHHHNFQLPSLVYSRDNIQSISPEDYALCTSPYLYSIVVRFGFFGDRGFIDYNKEAVIQVISGLAPNLAHVCVIQKQSRGELSSYQTWELGRPTWKGFFPEGTERGVNPPSVLGRLQSLVFAGYVPNSIEKWTHRTDFTNLRCLVIKWEANGIALAEIASRGDLKSLEKLDLLPTYREDDESEQSQNALNLLLSSLNPLQRLHLSGYLSPETFNIIVHRHGANLRTLLLTPERNEESRNPLVVFSAPVMQQLASHSPYLTYLSIPISRTRGDKNEVGIYRALSKLTSLKRLSLRLEYSVGPDEEFWDEERDGRHPLSREFTEGDSDKIPIEYLKEAFSNSAVDETLARGIFDLIAGGCRGTLEYLRLEPTRKGGRNAPGMYELQFRETLRWFNRSFVCTRDVYRDDKVTLKEIGTVDVAAAEEHWKFMMGDEEKWYGEEIFIEAFKDLWPQKTDEWWKDWSSLPLDLEEDTELEAGS